MVAALSSGGGSLADYDSGRQVGKGRFSIVFYTESKVCRPVEGLQI